jgi:2-polyprenyl-3-methyl-5-hydroxy-6-metoxy-1,4-benzoquinol methylase
MNLSERIRFAPDYSKDESTRMDTKAIEPLAGPHAKDVQVGDRFEFGKNWKRFLSRLDEKRIAEAEASLLEMLGASCLQGKSFLDIGCGSGLFSLAARRLGASVYSFDYDPECVGCTQDLKRRFFPDDAQWRIEEASALSSDYLDRLGLFDIVYSWGVLHHTGAMWEALANAGRLVKPQGGQLFIAIYNDQGRTSSLWRTIKRAYNRTPRQLRFAILWPITLYYFLSASTSDLLSRRPLRALSTNTGTRGMNFWTDVVDWVGGYPFEVAKPEQIFAFYRGRRFTLERLVTCGGRMGCNQYVLTRD